MAAVTTYKSTKATPLDSIERVAWGIRLPTRRLFVILAVTVALSLVAGGLVAGWVASRNSSTISAARRSGLQIGIAATSFRTALGDADAEAAATLISGGLEDPVRRGRYDSAMLSASRSLTGAALVADGQDGADIAELADGLVRYAGLVETSRANSRQGFPVGSAYLNQARAMARDDLVPRAERLRRSGEQRVARAANSVNGAVSVLAIVVLVLALLVLVVASVVAAGRTRRVTHPALLASLVVGVAALVVLSVGTARQGNELRTAANEDLKEFIAANDNAFTLSGMRVSEISAVAAHGSGALLYDQFQLDADNLLGRVQADSGGRSLVTALNQYLIGVSGVRALDEGGDNRAAATNTLEGPSAVGYATATEASNVRVGGAESSLLARFDHARDADVQPALPIVLASAAAALGAVGLAARARRYR